MEHFYVSFCDHADSPNGHATVHMTLLCLSHVQYLFVLDMLNIYLLKHDYPIHVCTYFSYDLH